MSDGEERWNLRITLLPPFEEPFNQAAENISISTAEAINQNLKTVAIHQNQDVKNGCQASFLDMGPMPANAVGVRQLHVHIHTL